MNIKGEYFFDITLQNMFHTYRIKVGNHNLITYKGLELMLKCMVNKSNNEFLGNVVIGTNNALPNQKDSTDTCSNPVKLETDYVDIENNKLTFYATTTGDVLDGTKEIGVWSSSLNPIAISRDVHDPYNIPTSATITVQYSFTLANSEDI